MRASDLFSHPFRDEALAWLRTRSGALGATTYQTYTAHARTLDSFFKRRQLADIRAKDIRAYQRFRMGVVGTQTIHNELLVLRLMLTQTGNWRDDLRDCYGRLKRTKPKRVASPKLPRAAVQRPAPVPDPVTQGTPRRGPLGITGFRNVTLRPSGKFRASVMVKRKRIVLGDWETAEAAATAAKEFKQGNSSYIRRLAARERALSVFDALMGNGRVGKAS